MEVESFKKAARSDKHMRLDCDGRALYICQALPTQVGPDTTAYTSTALYPLTQTFLLNSKPGAAKVIYLDFNGFMPERSYRLQLKIIDGIIEQYIDDQIYFKVVR